MVRNHCPSGAPKVMKWIHGHGIWLAKSLLIILSHLQLVTIAVLTWLYLKLRTCHQRHVGKVSNLHISQFRTGWSTWISQSHRAEFGEPRPPAVRAVLLWAMLHRIKLLLNWFPHLEVPSAWDLGKLLFILHFDRMLLPFLCFEWRK